MSDSDIETYDSEKDPAASLEPLDLTKRKLPIILVIEDSRTIQNIYKIFLSDCEEIKGIPITCARPKIPSRLKAMASVINT